MNMKRNNKGFTMMEMLVAVGILVVLMGVAFVGIINYQRTFKQKELDETARELFVAAQNHLTMAQSQGNLQSLEQGTQPDDAAEGDTVYYYFVDGPTETQLDPNDSDSRSSALYQMLPQFSIDDTVRRGGSYVIKYNTETATVLDVFYSDQSNLSDHTFVKDDYKALFVDPGYTGDDKASNRLEGYDGAIIGWYGGDDLGTAAPSDLTAPELTVRNAEVLEAKLKMSTETYNANKDISGLAVQLVITGETSGVSRLVGEYSLTNFQSHYDPDEGAYCITVVLDDITSSTGHFAQQAWCEDDKTTSVTEGVLIPGENITLYARVYSNQVLSKVVTSAKKHTNSLFAEIIEEEVAAAVAGQPATTQKVAQVTSIRHLENLDPAISTYSYETMSDDAAYVAEQGSDLQWSGDTGAFLEQIVANENRTGSESKTDDVLVYYAGGSTHTNAGTYAPVNPTYLTEYDGLNHTISNVKVSTADEAGLFGTLNVASSSIHDLKLVDFNIASTGKNAGALAGNVSGSSSKNITISNVIAYNSSSSIEKADSAITGSTAAGGLIGSATNSTIAECAAALYVTSTGTSAPAGGLVGTTSGGSITKSYAAGHLTESSVSSSDDDPKAVTYSTTAGNVTASGSSGIAGGLVGTTSSTGITYCYSTCSAFGAGTAGGLVGTVSGSSVTNSYATGLVGSATGTSDISGVTLGAFVGTNSSATFSNDTYLAIINETNSVYAVSTDTDSSTTSGISMADADTSSYKSFCSLTNDATPYASTLEDYYEGKYTFKTADELASVTDGTTVSATHYGDWPTPETLVLNTKSEVTYEYQIVISPDEEHYVGDTGVTATLQVSVNGGAYADVEGEVTWTSSDASKVKASDTTAQIDLTLVGEGTATITATVNGNDVASAEVIVLAKTSTVLVPTADVNGVAHNMGYLAYKEMNSQISGQNNPGKIYWEERTDASGYSYMAMYSLESWGKIYYLTYYNGTYYKPIWESSEDGQAGLDQFGRNEFYVSYLTSGEFYNTDDFWRSIKWVVADGPEGVLTDNETPGTRAFATDSSSEYYVGDDTISTFLKYVKQNVEWEPFRDDCMVAVYHSGGPETVGAVWYNGDYYVPRSNGVDVNVEILQTGFLNTHLTDNAEHTYAGVANTYTVVWEKIEDPYATT